MSRVKTLLQNVKDDFGEVLGGRHQRREIRQRVEILMIEAVEHGLPNRFIEINQITDHTGLVTDLTADGYCERVVIDRKSTRLKSSHLGISYAVFCLKKKKIKYNNLLQNQLVSTSISLSSYARCS